MPTIEVPDNALGYWDASYKKDNSVIAWYIDSDSNNLYELYIDGYGKVYAPAYSVSLFQNFTKVTEIDFGNVFDTSKETSMTNMFSTCRALTSLNVDSFDTTNVTSLYRVFLNCSNLTNLDLSSFNTSKVTDISGMFQSCSKLESIDLRNSDFESITNTSYTFYYASSLKEINLSNITSDKYSISGFKTFITGLGSSKNIYVKDSSCITLGQSINSNLNYVVYEESV